MRDKLQSIHVVICGVGAVGSNLADALVRAGLKHLRAIDDDRVESHNVANQLYDQTDVGTWKVEALRNHLFRAAGVEIEAVRKRLTPASARALLRDGELVIDALDNAASRQVEQDAVRASNAARLHVGLHEEHAEVVWDETYRVPHGAASSEMEDVCAATLSRSLVLLAVAVAVAVASQSVREFVVDAARQRRRSWTLTLRDFGVREME